MEKLNQELGLDSLQQRQWYRKSCFFFKTMKNQSLNYFFELIPTARQMHITRQKNIFPLFNVNHGFKKIFFFRSTIIQWNNLDPNIRNSDSLSLFKKRILAFIRLSANSNFHCHDPKTLKEIRRLRLGLSHLRFYEFKQPFQDKLNVTCNWLVLPKQLFTTFFIVPIFQLKD